MIPQTREEMGQQTRVALDQGTEAVNILIDQWRKDIQERAPEEYAWLVTRASQERGLWASTNFGNSDIHDNFLYAMYPEAYMPPRKMTGYILPLIGSATVIEFYPEGQINAMRNLFSEGDAHYCNDAFYTTMFTPSLSLIHVLAAKKGSPITVAPWAPPEGSQNGRQYLEEQLLTSIPLANHEVYSLPSKAKH